MAAEKRSTSKPWKKAAPKKSRHTKLTPATKAKAKASAKKAGRPYPNLVDNMKAAAKQRSGSTKRSATAKTAKKGGASKSGK